MAVTIQKKDLNDLLQKAFPIIPAKTSLTMLMNFRITLVDSTLEVWATDLDHSMRLKAPAQGNAPFDIMINAKKISEIVRELPDGLIILNSDENVILIQTESGFSCKLAGADGKDFPGFPDAEESRKTFTIFPSLLRDMIGKSSFAVAKDESRACLSGIFWETSAEKTGMVATDGHRLGSCFINGTFPVEEKVTPIIPPKAVMNLIRILDPKNQSEQIQVDVGEKYVTFSNPNMVLCSKLVEGPYPDYTKVIPPNNPRQAIIDRAVFQNAVRRVSVLSNQKTHLIKMIFNPTQVEIMVFNRDIGGEARESIPVEYTGDTHTIGFNGQYLNEILDIIKEPKIRIEMNTQISACLIFPVYAKPEERLSDDLFLIMPLRIMDEV